MTPNRHHPGYSKHYKPHHIAVARTVVYALTIGDADNYAALSDVMAKRLPLEERIGLAWAASKSMDEEDACRIYDCTCAGMPGLPMEDKAEEAAFWADLADPVELRAYCLATFKRMSSEDKADFLNHVLKRSAA